MKESEKMTEMDFMAAELELIAHQKNGPSVPDNLMEAFIEGRLEGDEKQKVLEQILASPESLALLKMNLAMDDLPQQEGQNAKIIAFPRWFQPVATLAAVAVLVFGLFLFMPDSQQSIDGTIPMNKEVLQFVQRNDRWTGQQDLDGWKAVFADAGYSLDQLKEVRMEKEYFTAKSFDAPEEEVVFRFEDGVLYITIREKGSEDETQQE